MDPGIADHLVQHETGNVLSRDFTAMKVSQVGKRPDHFTSGLVIENGGPNDSPIQSTVLDEGFLTVLVLVNLPQKQRKDQPVEQKAPMSIAIASTNSCDADKA